MLLALPSGVLADRFDRRRLLITAQIAMGVICAALAALAFAGHLGPGALLGLTLVLGCANTLMSPAWQAIQPELVDRGQLGAASALGAVNMNLARAVGPALGGLVVAAAGAGWVFAFNAVSFVGIVIVLLTWQRPRTTAADAQYERFLPALVAARRYVWYAPGVRRILLRTALFIPGAAALWSLLPLVASGPLHLGSGGYGLLLAAVGAGAVGGAFALSRLRRLIGANGILAAGGAVFAAVVAVLAVVHVSWIVAVALLPAGVAWIAVLSTLNAAMQTRVPGWVRARALAVYLLVFQGGQAITSPVWGALAQHLGLRTTFLIAAGLLLAGAGTVRLWPLYDPDFIDPAPSNHWPVPSLVFEPGPADGPVLVSIVYRVEPDKHAAFREAMRNVALSRRRTGALTWGLFQDGGDRTRFIENYLVGSWAEHLAQHGTRVTGTDRHFEDLAHALLAPGSEPEVTHAFEARDVR